jgi:hypothetical protein
MGIFDRRPDPNPDNRKSTWLTSERIEHPGTKECKDCKGTGSSGFVSESGATIVCPSCRGFGY